MLNGGYANIFCGKYGLSNVVIKSIIERPCTKRISALISFCSIPLIFCGGGCANTVITSSSMPVDVKTRVKIESLLTPSATDRESMGEAASTAPALSLGRSDQGVSRKLEGILSSDSASLTKAAEGEFKLPVAVMSTLERLGPAYAHLILEMGEPAERDTLFAALEKLNNPALLESVVGWYLSQENSEAARFWINQARIQHHLLPFWQQSLAALRIQDQEALQNLLDENGKELPPSIKVDVLQSLNRDSEALAVAQEQLEYVSEPAESDNLRRQIRLLTIRLANRLTPVWELRSLASLTVMDLSVQADGWVGDATHVTGVASRRRLSADSKDLNLEGFDIEHDVYLEFTHDRPTATIAGRLGANLRDDQSLAYGRLSWAPLLGKGWLGRLELSINEIGEETPAFRALGVKDRLSISTLYNITSSDYARLRLGLHRYYTRERSRLAEGYGIGAEIGHFLLRQNPSWQIRLQTSIEDNSLSKELPSELEGILPASATVGTLVPDKFSMMGIGTTLIQGIPLGEAGNYSGFADAWTGWVWPANAFGFNLQVGLGQSISGNDQLALSAFYANTAGGRTENAYSGVKVQYTLLF